jgi:hypothetical protein
MQKPRFSPLEGDNTPFNPEEFEAGYIARLAGEPQCLNATRGWRAGWVDADAGFSNSEISKAS